MKSLESIYNSILLENQNTNIDIDLLERCIDGIPGTYTINNDGSIDVDGGVDLSNKNLSKIPFKFRNVSGGFYCCGNQLTSLEGAPKSVGGGFGCYDNQLTSLLGAPNNVSGGFYCDHNQLTTLDGTPKTVGGRFLCYDNPNLPYSELFKIVDRVKGDIYYYSYRTTEDKDKIRRDRDVKEILKSDELGNLDV